MQQTLDDAVRLMRALETAIRDFSEREPDAAALWQTSPILAARGNISRFLGVYDAGKTQESTDDHRA